MSNPARIIVVEDNTFVRMQIVRFLKAVNDQLPVDVLEFDRGDKALEASNQSVDLAIVDVRMEPVDGLEFVRSLRGADLHFPVILVTGDNNPDLLEQASKWGISAILMKPVEKDRLVKTVIRTLASRKKET